MRLLISGSWVRAPRWALYFYQKSLLISCTILLSINLSTRSWHKVVNPKFCLKFGNCFHFCCKGRSVQLWFQEAHMKHSNFSLLSLSCPLSSLHFYFFLSLFRPHCRRISFLQGIVNLWVSTRRDQFFRDRICPLNHIFYRPALVVYQILLSAWKDIFVMKSAQAV